MIKLRPYQKEGAELGIKFFLEDKSDERPIIIAPTAAGKSIYAAYMANKLKKGVLVLQPTKELLEQNYQKFKMYGGEASIFSASAGVKEVGEVTFAMIGSIVKKPELFRHVKYVIIDECHLVPPSDTPEAAMRKMERGKATKNPSMYSQFFNQLPGVKVIGLTATAVRVKKYRDPWTRQPYAQINLLPRERPRFFDSFLHVTQIGDLYKQGFLCPLEYAEITWSNHELKVNTTGAEYTQDSIEQAIKNQMVYERIPAILRQSMDKGRKFRLVFVDSVAKAEEMASLVPYSACVSAETKPKERERILEQFKAGRIKTVFNVGVLTTGFDFPELDTIVIARPTMSLTLYMQMVGRGLRIHPDKKNCVVLDLCGNFKRFGKIEEIRYDKDYKGNWVLTQAGKVLSGVRIK